MSGKLTEKVIIVTGGSGLIGREIINDINSNGGIALNADKVVDTDISNRRVQLDITENGSIQRAVAEIHGAFGRIDGLVNNAYPRTGDWADKFEDIKPESWRMNVDMQLNGLFMCSQQVLKLMEKQKGGSIVNISSIYGVVGNDFTLYEDYDGTSPAAYSAIKGGIINFTRYLASYYGRKGIRVNCVSPGGIMDNQHQSFIDKYEAKVPIGRLGKPDDIAPAVSFLLSDDAKYITGHNLIVDGGWTAI
jgi:NAD(P)-dependent dehydrogenase (short-subunit alcohol dehydrogenase family)